ncbi:MAG: CBS domain-containing protein [Anaerolineae bacterium]|nr:CBS domain-containing protein [Anaerolineae bacterium]
MTPTNKPTEQEKFGRHRPVTDLDAHEINRIEELSYDLKIHEVMNANVITTSPDVPIASVLELMRVNRISGVPVVQDEKLVGIISLEDIVRALQSNELAEPVKKYMTGKLVTVRHSDSIVEAIKRFTEKGLGRLPVVDEANNLKGIITKGDITRGILRAVQHDYKEEEVRRYRASHLFEDINSDRTTLVLRYNIKVGDFTHGGNASSHIKRALLRLGADQQLARRCGIAAYEAEMNLIIHTTHGGVLKLEVEPHRIIISTSDDGPGIADIEKVLQPGYSTASDKVREMGFGAGMGLVNIKRCVDKMELESTLGKGSKLIMRIAVPSEVLKGKRE